MHMHSFLWTGSTIGDWEWGCNVVPCYPQAKHTYSGREAVCCLVKPVQNIETNGAAPDRTPHVFGGVFHDTRVSDDYDSLCARRVAGSAVEVWGKGLRSLVRDRGASVPCTYTPTTQTLLASGLGDMQSRLSTWLDVRVQQSLDEGRVSWGPRDLTGKISRKR
jgi:hypothetical protein